MLIFETIEEKESTMTNMDNLIRRRFGLIRGGGARNLLQLVLRPRTYRLVA